MENASIKVHKKTPKPQILGPVEDLEPHLKPDWWKRIFNSFYLKTDGDVVEDLAITDQEVDRFVQILGLRVNDEILDLACGQGRHLLALSRRGFNHLNGLDRSRYLIQKARNRAKKEALRINFKEGDIRKLPFETDRFDAITILGNSFGYFENPEDDIHILREIFRVLTPNGQLLLDLTDGSYIKMNFEPRSWEWIDKKHFVCRERSLAADQERLISREVITHVEKGVMVDQFYAERLYSADQLKSLLTKAGFQTPVFHGALEAQSQRNQDLGMMQKRMLITARVVKEWTPRKKATSIKDVAVILGDPHIQDKIKPKAIFDADDFHTIHELKNALHALSSYRFTYYSRHDRLIHDLQKARGKIDFVLNLCDEGFQNDACKELHVPALLEILNIPYSGSNPQTLAYCYDKSLIRGIATEIDIPVASGMVIKPEDSVYEFNLSFPVIAKPNFGDSSFGITQNNVAHTVSELEQAILRLRAQFGLDKPILLESFLTGAEISVGIIGNAPSAYQVLPIVEEDYSQLPEGLPKICGYEAKWLNDSPYYHALKSIPAELPVEVEQQLVHDCLKLYERLELRDYARFDWRLDAKGHPKLLEVNPNPGWCWDGHLAKMAEFAGISYSQMLENILQATEQRLAELMDG